MEEEQKEEKGVFLVQREYRVSIPRGMRQNLGIHQGSFVWLSIRKATDEEILEALKKK
jgi:bifunctional DNA-binding transcriptional regulator/antitoxin component of YhaV-PrlF toxin-antitoxin module